MRYFILLLLTVCAFGYQSLNVSTTATVNLVIPNTGIYSAPGDYRISFRLHNWTPPGSGTATLFQFGYFKVTLSAASLLCGANENDTENAYGNNVCVSVSGLTDVTVRGQRFATSYPVTIDSSNGTFIYPGGSWFEVQDNSTGNILSYKCATFVKTGCPITTAHTVTIVGTTNAISAVTIPFSLAWLKWWSTTVQPNTPLENEFTPADIGDWRFEGNFTNQATGASLPVLGGTHSSTAFSGSPVLNPICGLIQTTYRAGISNTLSTYSYALDTTGILTYYWNQVSGPTNLIWNNITTATPTVNGAIFGSYVIQLSLQDGTGDISSCTIKDGFVVTDNNFVTTTGTGGSDILLGPQIMFGANPWTYQDDRHKADALVQTANLVTYFNGAGGTATTPWNVAGPGTINTTNSSTTIVGTSTTFQTTFCGGSGNTTPPAQGATIGIWYPWVPNVSGVGLRQMTVTACTDDTHITVGSGWNTTSLLLPQNPVGGGWQYSWIDGTNVSNNWLSAIYPANFYDIVAGLYSLYYRSGIDDYRTTARAFADNFWQYRLDSGNNYFYGEGRNTAYRNLSILGMILRALDGRPDMWSGLETMAAYSVQFNHLGISLPWTHGIGGSQDAREMGYDLMGMSMISLLDPNTNSGSCYLGGTGTPSACTRLGISDLMTNGFGSLATEFPDGNPWYVISWGGMGGGANSNHYGSWSDHTCAVVINGSPTVTCVPGATPGCGNGSGTCSWGTYSSMFTFNDNSSPPVAQPTAWWFFPTPGTEPTNNTQGDSIAYFPTSVNTTTITLDQNYQGTSGTVGWMSGGPIVGSVGYDVQPYMLGILSSAWYYASLAMACTGVNTPANCDNSIAAAATTYAINGANYIKTTGYNSLVNAPYYIAGSVDCTPQANIPTCTDSNNISEARQIGTEAMRGIIAGYTLSNDPALKTFTDSFYTYLWGRPGFAVASGQSIDGTYLQGYNDGFGSNITATAGAGHKYFGMGFGISAGSDWPAVRQGGLTPAVNSNVNVQFKLSSVPNATKVSISLADTFNSSATTTCLSSPCSVPISAGHGGHILTLQYLSNGNVVLASSQIPIWTIQ